MMHTARMLVAGLVLLGLWTASWAASDLASVSRFNIPAGPLPTALHKFTEQSGVQVTGPADLIDSKQTNGISGDYSAAAALSQLLAGTQLDFDTVNSRTVSIRRERGSDPSRS